MNISDLLNDNPTPPSNNRQPVEQTGSVTGDVGVKNPKSSLKEDELLEKLRSENQTWHELAFLPGRTSNDQQPLVEQTRSVTSDVMANTPKWSFEEDKLLKKLRNEKKTWHDIALHFPLRTRKQCCARYNDCLTGKTYSCERCSRKFRRKAGLRRHKTQVHIKKKLHFCVCETGFVREADLRR